MAALLFLSLLLTPIVQSSNLTYRPRPYEISVDKGYIEDIRLRASRFRSSTNIDAPAWFDGPPSANLSKIANYWATEFDYGCFEHELNHNFSNYITTVPPPSANYNRSVDLHFIHQRSHRDDAIPIILLHGWPSTSLEWAKVIPGLVNPPNASLPAFHVVAPDLPGYGFSPAPTAPGLAGKEHAAVFASLMQQLGYDRYVLYSTDLGFLAARHMVPDYSERIINHVTDFYVVFPNDTDITRFQNNQTTPEETAYLLSLTDYQTAHYGYISIQSTLPLALSYALYDSPVGFLAWMWQIAYTVSDVDFSAEELIRRALPLYIPGPYGNIRSYKEHWNELMTFQPRKTNVPTSVTQWGGTVAYPALANSNYVPIDWVKRTANVTFFQRHPKGGHFPAESQPRAWLESMWKIFAT